MEEIISKHNLVLEEYMGNYKLYSKYIFEDTIISDWVEITITDNAYVSMVTYIQVDHKGNKTGTVLLHTINDLEKLDKFLESIKDSEE